MKFKATIKIAGLCLVALLSVSLVAAGTASAKEYVWEQCTTEKTTVTKYTTDYCTTASSEGVWGWKAIENTEKVQGRASLKLWDTVLGIKVVVMCTGSEHGLIGPGKFGRIQSITEIICTKGENCEKLEKNAVPLNLPWQTELTEKEGARRNVISEGTGKLLPGWEVECKVLGIVKNDKCENNTGHTAMTNKQADGSVWAYFDNKTPKAKCTASGGETGGIEGSVRIEKEGGQAIRVN